MLVKEKYASGALVLTLLCGKDLVELFIWVYDEAEACLLYYVLYKSGSRLWEQGLENSVLYVFLYLWCIQIGKNDRNMCVHGIALFMTWNNTSITCRKEMQGTLTIHIFLLACYGIIRCQFSSLLKCSYQGASRGLLFWHSIRIGGLSYITTLLSLSISCWKEMQGTLTKHIFLFTCCGIIRCWFSSFFKCRYQGAFRGVLF